MWMPAQTTTPPLPTARSAAGTSAPTGAKTIAASSSSGAGPAESPAHSAPSSSASDCGRVVAAAGEGEHPPALVDGDLADDVRGRAEAVEAEALGVAGHAQRAVADQPGAEQRRDLLVGMVLGEREAEALVGDGQLGVAAVELVAGEAGAVAEVLAAGAAEAAGAVGPAQPRHADALALRVALAVAGDAGDDLVAEHERQLRLGQLAVGDVQVGATDPAGGDLAAAPAPAPALGRAAPATRAAGRARRAPSRASAHTIPRCASVRSSTPSFLREHLDELTVVDCRFALGEPGAGERAYLAGHIPGAAFLDLDRDLAAPPGERGRHPLPSAEDFAAAARRAGIDDDRRVVAYDEAGEGGAARLWWLLRHFGHEDVAVLDGGLRGVEGGRGRRWRRARGGRAG